MIPDAATTSTPAPQPAAPGTQPASATPAPQLTPVQLLWEVATLAFDLMRRLVHVLRPIQQYYPKPALLLARLLIDIPRIFLTLRYAPERATKAQLRHLTRARHILQALFNYTLPSSLGTPISRLASAASASQSPSASTESLGARTPSSATTPSPAISAASSPNAPSSTTPGAHKPSSATSATPSIRQVPETPMVAGVSHVPASPTVDRNPLTPPPSHISHPSQTSQSPQSAFPDPQSANNNSAFRIQHSAFSPFVPDFHTLAQALKADSLPPNCAGALFEDPGDALVRALHQLHTIYFSLYPNQSPSPSPSQSPSQSSANPSEKTQWAFETTIRSPQSGTPQSDAPFVNPVNPVNSVHLVHSTSDNVHSPLDPSHPSHSSHHSHSSHPSHSPYSTAPP